MCIEKSKELVRVFGLCPWSHKYLSAPAPHKRDHVFEDADEFLLFIDREASFDYDWELYLIWVPTRGARKAQVVATCVGRQYNRGAWGKAG